VSVADEKLDVEVVSVEKKVWTGEATFIRARTVDGEIGILPGHEQTLAQLEEAPQLAVLGLDRAQVGVLDCLLVLVLEHLACKPVPLDPAGAAVGRIGCF
jgi:hypothetical protein